MLRLYDEATADEVRRDRRLTQTAMRVLRADSHCDGFNIGMNQGAIAGAGVADHLHQHVVPRWATDANFFPIIAETKALPVLLGDIRASLAAAWPALSRASPRGMPGRDAEPGAGAPRPVDSRIAVGASATAHSTDAGTHDDGQHHRARSAPAGSSAGSPRCSRAA